MTELSLPHPPSDPPGTDRDAVTARLLADGSSEGLRRLLVDHGGRVHTLLSKDFESVLDETEIEDAVSQANIRVWRSGKQIDLSRGSLRAWYYVVARNCALRLLECKRRRGALRFVDDLDAMTTGNGQVVASDSEAEATRRRQVARDLHRCIDALPSLQRAVILADLAAGGVATTEQLVRDLDTTPNSIYVSRTNGRKALRTAMIRLGHVFAEDVGAGSGAPNRMREAMP